MWFHLSINSDIFVFVGKSGPYIFRWRYGKNDFSPLGGSPQLFITGVFLIMRSADSREEAELKRISGLSLVDG